MVAVVQVYDARTGGWERGTVGDLEVGDEVLHEGHLLRVAAAGVEDRGFAEVGQLSEADATWTVDGAVSIPDGDDWVLVLGDDVEAGHWRLQDLAVGERFAFGGRVFESDVVDGELAVRATEQVLSRVVQTFVRQSDTVIDAEIAYEDGTVEVITGTPEHPFWVPKLQAWVPLGELVEGTELHADAGAGAILVSSTWRQGDFTVYNFEVEGTHNYFVRAPGSDAPAVLVHNVCFRGSLPRNAGSFLRNKQKRISNQAAAGGNRGVSGTVSGADAEALGQAWVGDGAREFGGGMGLISEDGTRVFRRPSAKRGVNAATGEPWSKTGVQSNFEVRSKGADGKWQIDANVHLDVEP